MIRSVLVAIGLACALGAGAAAPQAPAAAKPAPETGCTQPLEACTKQRTAALRAQSRQVRDLAERGTAATTAEIQTAFNREYMQLQQRIRREHRQFDEISNIIKSKHDAASKAIEAMR